MNSFMYADTFTDMNDGHANFFGPDAKVVLRARLEKLFREYHVEWGPIIIDISIAGVSDRSAWISSATGFRRRGEVGVQL
jgi:hypothetical protein